MSTYMKLEGTTKEERELLRDHFLSRIYELEDEILNQTKYTKVNDLKKLVQCNKRWLSWISEPPSNTVQ